MTSQKGDFLMKQGYEIRVLPSNVIEQDGQFYKIKGGTFPHIPVKLPIREKAMEFSERTKMETVYAVLYANEDAIQCLFFFTLSRNKRDEPLLEIIRCVGKRAVKKHWQTVRDLILEREEDIIWLYEDNDFLTFK